MKRADLTVKRFGCLTVTGVHSSDGRRARWACACDCGGAAVVIADNLTRGHSTRCRTHPRAEQPKKEHPLYQVWKEMHRRCRDPRATSYQRYGARGVRVCAEWGDFWRFVADMGPRPTPEHQLDRERGSDLYSKPTCRWATAGENSRNRDFVKLNDEVAAAVKALLISGQRSQSVARLYGVSQRCIDDIKRGRTWNHVGPLIPAPDGVIQP